MGTPVQDPWKAPPAERHFSISHHISISHISISVSGMRQPLYVKSLFLGAFIIQEMLVLVQ